MHGKYVGVGVGISLGLPHPLGLWNGGRDDHQPN